MMCCTSLSCGCVHLLLPSCVLCNCIHALWYTYKNNKHKMIGDKHKMHKRETQ